jgi:hypothetical protein
MKSSGKPSRRKRAVGSIIGAVFLVLTILSGFTFYQLYLNIADHYNGALQSMGESDWSRNREKIVINNVEITGSGNLSVTVENEGTLQSHLIWFGIFNMSALPETQAYYSLDISVDPAETKSVVSVFTVVQGSKYAVQLVTELGNTIGFKFYPASEVRCRLTLTTAPPTAYKGNNVTVALTVTHNDSEVDAIQSLTVSLSPTPSGLVQLMDNSSLTARGLRKGESAFFWWIYSTIGTGTAILNATYGQAPAGVYAITSLTVLDSPGQGGAGTVSITGVNCTVPYYPSKWSLLGSTANVSGSVFDLVSNDSSYVVFRSYPSAGGSNTTLLNDGFEGATWDDNWDVIAHTWRRSTNTVHSGSASAYATSGYAGYFTCNSLDASNADFIYIDFWFRKSGIHATDFTLYYYDGTAYNLIVELDSRGADDTWLHYTEKVTSSQYFVPDFRIRFDATMGGGHYAYVDDVLIKKECSEYTAEVEFTGSSNPQSWTQLVWLVDSSWDIGSVNVTIQLYDYTLGPLGGYPLSGDGYLSYVSNSTSNTDELKNEQITSGSTRFRNSTSPYYWKVKIKGAKSTSTPFLMKIDWIDLQTTYSSTGDTIPYNAWQLYSMKATTTSGGPIPYAYVSIYANGTNIVFRNATDKTLIGNPTPTGVRLDKSGTIQLELKSASGSSETFVLYAVVGSLVGQKTVTQEAP